MRQRPRLFTIFCALMCMAWLAMPASGDWLVMKDGSKLETKGEWKVKGRMVVFTLPNGSLSSIRVSEVDLDASAVATVAANEDATEPEAEAPKAEPKPVAVLTNADIGRARRAPSSGDAEAPNASAEAASTESGLQAQPINVEVIAWNDVDSIAVQGVEIRGTLRNRGETLARELVLIVSLFDNNGELVASSEAFLDKYLLQPGGTTDFRVLFPETATYFGEPGFQVRGRGPLYGKITGIDDPRNPSSEDSSEPSATDESES